ncbi:MAG: coproporphyrinogen dehydrogenase HemZ, partial [Oscillospiraceae bacterium]|nr:coproporphyrinogen dehydrogenase HemZ [Candidatus Equicaccousia limihippi]
GLPSVTVHTLSVKRAADFAKSITKTDTVSGAKAMTDYARAALTCAGMEPYYMYRQSKTVENLENVGYAKPGHFCSYNVFIMDETHTVVGLGAGAVTKLKQPHGEIIERVPNYKFPYEYINRFDEMLARKDKIGGFYNAYSCRNK